MPATEVVSVGGYDEGYAACPCFWGSEPGSLVSRFASEHRVGGMRVLDVGCGEGKNAVFLAEKGAHVTAIDISPRALSNGRQRWANVNGIDWICADAREYELPAESFDLVVAYGLLHCLRDENEIRQLVDKLRRATRQRGVHIVCAFNDRRQELEAHAGFSPVLLTHRGLLSLYNNDEIIWVEDADIHETHPHNGVAHTHSLTRIAAKLRHG